MEKSLRMPFRFDPRREARRATVTISCSACLLAARRSLFEIGWDNAPRRNLAFKIAA
jgi:hypothetical protein